MAAATVSLLIGLTLVGERGQMWRTRQVQVTLGLAVLLWAAFVLAECRAGDPVLSLDLFRNRVFAANAGLTFFLWMALFGMAFYLPLFLQGVLRASPTTAGLAMTPFSLSIVVGNVLAGVVIGWLRRYQAVALSGALCLTAGMGLLAQMAPTVLLTFVALFAAVTGFGMGMLFTATSVVVQRALPPSRLGEGFGVVRYLGQIGGVLGLALVGTVVNISLDGELRRRIPEKVAQHLAAEGVRLAAGPQVLISPAFHRAVMQRLSERASEQVSPGPGHAARVAAAAAREMALLNQAFEALRLSLAAATRHGLLAALIFCAGAITAALLLRDVQRGG